MELPDLSYEKILWNEGFVSVAGMDEVGRGALAGPVVAATVVFDRGIIPDNIPVKINDSKKLNSDERRKASVWIIDNAVWGIGASSVSEINRIGIVKATNKAFRRSLISAQQMSKLSIDYLLIDGFYIPNTRKYPLPLFKHKKRVFCGKYMKGKQRQLAIVRGDQKCLSIASASIIAKVWRDNYMIQTSINPKLKTYKFMNNKGYGTLDHRIAISKHGITRFHRKQFVKKFC